MKRISKMVVMVAALVSAGVGAAKAEDPSVREIVDHSNYVSLYQGDDCKGKLQFTITDKQGRTRRRVLNILRKDIGADGGDQKYFTCFIAPSDVRNMTFMVHKHADIGHDDDRWLYMPGLDLVKRIAASDKRTSFVGSDFLYEDISGRSPEEDDHELVETTDRFYIIKNMPKKGGVEFDYYLASIDKKTGIAMKLEYYKKNDVLYRDIVVKEMQNVPAGDKMYPTVTRSVARDYEKGSSTEMIFSGIVYDTGIRDNVFTERYLRKPSRDVLR